jgi:hypothetical protein
MLHLAAKEIGARQANSDGLLDPLPQAPTPNASGAKLIGVDECLPARGTAGPTGRFPLPTDAWLFHCDEEADVARQTCAATRCWRSPT